jgi:hypothetical protein
MQVVKLYEDGRATGSPLLSVPEFLYLCKVACPMDKITVINHSEQLAHPFKQERQVVGTDHCGIKRNRSTEDVGSESK